MLQAGEIIGDKRKTDNKDTKDSSCITQFTNCNILKDHTIIVDDLWVRKGQILNPEELFYLEKGYADVKIDCGGALLAPGFIDTQINGKSHHYNISLEVAYMGS